MGVVAYTECIGCSRAGRAYTDTNFIYECDNCKIYHINNKLKKSMQQVWWIRFLYWLIDKKPVTYNKNNCEILFKELNENNAE